MFWIGVINIGSTEMPCNSLFWHVGVLDMSCQIEVLLICWLLRGKSFWWIVVGIDVEHKAKSDGIPPIFHLLFELFALKLGPKLKSMCLVNNYMGHERAIIWVEDCDEQLMFPLLVDGMLQVINV